MKVVLFDRDGTLIVDPLDERVDSESDIKLFPDTITALKRLADNGFSIILITNQAGVAEGRLTLADFYRIESTVNEQLKASGINILKIYVCPHGPNHDCACRKPKPALILRALAAFDLDPATTFMVGDHSSDVLAGKNAGVQTILVHTANRPDHSPDATYETQNLTEAVDIIIKTAH